MCTKTSLVTLLLAGLYIGITMHVLCLYVACVDGKAHPLQCHSLQSVEWAIDDVELWIMGRLCSSYEPCGRRVGSIFRPLILGAVPLAVFLRLVADRALIVDVRRPLHHVPCPRQTSFWECEDALLIWLLTAPSNSSEFYDPCPQCLHFYPIDYFSRPYYANGTNCDKLAQEVY